MKKISIFCLFSLLLGCRPDLEIIKISIDYIDLSQNWAKVGLTVLNTTTKEIKEQGVEMGAELNFKRIAYDSPLDKNFSLVIYNLEPNTIYQIRPYIIFVDNSIAFGEYKEFTTLDYQKFIISGAKIKNLVADNGDIYVSGTFHNRKVGFVAKFDSDGILSWLKNTPDPVEYSYPTGKMIISNGVLYTNVSRNDKGFGVGNIYLDAYNTENGDLNWSTRVREDYGIGSSLKIDADGSIWSIMGSTVALVSKEGMLLKHVSLGMGVSDLAFIEGELLFVGSADNEAIIKKFDKDLKLIFVKTLGVSGKPSNIQDLIYFSNANLLVLGRFSGSFDGIGGPGYPELDLMAYEVLGDNFNLKWEKKFSKTYSIMFACNSQNDFYFSSDNSQTAIGPAKVSLEGNISQLVNSKNGRITLSGSKVFLADGGEKLTIY